MVIYEHKTLLPTASGSVNSTTLRIPGGLAKYLLIRANTSTTVFRANLNDEDGITRLNYGYHQGEIRDDTLEYPLTGTYTLQVTNASPNDTFRIILSVQER